MPDDEYTANVELGDGDQFVDGRAVDWRGIARLLFVVPVFIIAEAGANGVDALLSLPASLFVAGGEVYSRLVSMVFDSWGSIFLTSFEIQADSIAGYGVLAFATAMVGIAVWFLVVERVMEAL